MGILIIICDFLHAALDDWGGRVERMPWINLQCRGILLIWIIVGQGPTVLVAGVGGSCLDIFLSLLSSFSCSLEEIPIWTEILFQRAVKPQSSNQSPG